MNKQNINIAEHPCTVQRETETKSTISFHAVLVEAVEQVVGDLL